MNAKTSNTHDKVGQKTDTGNRAVTWPAAAVLFTVEDLQRLNPQFVEITLRVRLSKAIEAGRVAEIGSIPIKMGRPHKVFSLAPITHDKLNKAKAEGINLLDAICSPVEVALAE